MTAPRRARPGAWPGTAEKTRSWTAHPFHAPGSAPGAGGELIRNPLASFLLIAPGRQLAFLLLASGWQLGFLLLSQRPQGAQGRRGTGARFEARRPACGRSFSHGDTGGTGGTEGFRVGGDPGACPAFGVGSRVRERGVWRSRLLRAHIRAGVRPWSGAGGRASARGTRGEPGASAREVARAAGVSARRATRAAPARAPRASGAFAFSRKPAQDPGSARHEVPSPKPPRPSVPPVFLCDPVRKEEQDHRRRPEGGRLARPGSGRSTEPGTLRPPERPCALCAPAPSARKRARDDARSEPVTSCEKRSKQRRPGRLRSSARRPGLRGIPDHPSRARSSSTRRSARSMCRRAASTASALTETESIPHSTSRST